MNPEPSVPASTVDAQNPWLGLASFTEETRSFFHGRDEDAAELTRRVQRKLLTILFGQSGHGKTSLLRAGLVPRLRPEGYCPVYVRLDYSRGAPTPAEQIKEAIFRATRAAGHWTQTGSSVAGESLWEFLHHRDDVLKDERGRPLIPLLIFDQFEEIFTIAQTDDDGRQRAQTFLADLADLVENRPPAELEARIDRDETDAAKFDFARADYRILIALREDYLAHLEGLKNEMPSVTQNRVRLDRFTGAQAISAVRGPAPQLVSEAVAAQIVRFVSGGTDHARAEVEPSLLSLVCRELNNARIKRGQTEITADLLEGSRDTILQEFYERALADQPVGVRSFIEDELLTDSGYRESVAEERVIKAFAAAGAAPDALAALVGRRLLRVEERLDVRRVELTHDVLAGVVVASRGLRREREAKQAAEAQLRATQEKEAAAQRALWRARRVALVCAVLAVGAAGSAVFGYFNYRRARSAENDAIRSAAEARSSATQRQATEELAQEARTEAEKIVSFLLDDFYNELEPIGRLDIVGDLARRAVDYYRALPVTLRSPITVRNYALALTRYGAVLAYQGKTDESGPLLEEAIRTFQRLQSNGDDSPELSIGLALALRNQARKYYSQGQRDAALASAQAAVDSLRARATGPGASAAVRLEFAEDLNRLGFQQLRAGLEEKSLGSLGESRDVFASLGARDASNLRAAAAYADTAAWVMEAASFLGRSDEAETVGLESGAIAAKVIEKNPGDRRALRARALTERYLSDVYADRQHLGKALEVAEQAERDYAQLLQLDPTNAISRNNLGVSQTSVAGLMASQGLLEASLSKMEGIMLNENTDDVPVSNLEGFFFVAHDFGVAALQMGNPARAQPMLDLMQQTYAKLIKGVSPESFERKMVAEAVADVAYTKAAAAGDYASAAKEARGSLGRWENTKPHSAGEKEAVTSQTRITQSRIASAEYHLGHLPEAEKAIREAVNSWQLQGPKFLNDRKTFAQHQTLLALIVAKQGRLAEAAAIIAPVLKFERDLAASGFDSFQQIDLISAIYVTALVQPESAQTLLGEADGLLGSLSDEVRNLHDCRDLAQWIAAARTTK